MAIKFNPLTGNFDFTGSGGGGGGSAFFAGEVATYADLPLDGTAALDSRWLVRSNSGTWPFSSYKQAGVYVRKAIVGSSRDNDYQLTDTTFFDVMSDNKFLVFDNSDATKGLAFDVGTNVPTSSTVTLTVPASSGTIALTSQLGGGTKTYAVFTAEHNQPPATAFATLDTRNSIAVLDFDDTTDESAVFVGIIPEAASLGSGLKIRLHWMATTATSGNVVWDVSLERMTTDLDSDSFDTIASGAPAAANGTSGILTVTEITLTTIDSVTAGDGYRLKVTRDANNASDTMTGDAELVAVEIRSAA
jgi:hypothetical protein